MGTFSKKFTLRDSGSPTTTVDLYYIRATQTRPRRIFIDRVFTLENGAKGIDYTAYKREYNFTIEIQAGLKTNLTAADLTKIETLFALRTTQTIQLVDNWNESAEVVTIHFKEFEILKSIAGTDMYRFKLLEA